MRRIVSSALDIGARVLYGAATAIDVVADWISRRHRDDKYGF